MSAARLREAAALMRERAEAASAEDDFARAVRKFGRLTPKGQHIASWHPTVALAVADWLDEVARRQAPTEHYDRRSHGWTGARQANAVADAYLGSAS